jgi:FHA domain
MANGTHRAGTPDGRTQRPSGADETTSWDKTAASQPALAVRSGGEPEGRILEIRPGSQVIGRQPDCELRLNDRLVSRRHAVVVRENTTVTIQDAGSANGTRVNGEQLRADPRVLQSGDVVQVGRVDLVYLDGLEAPLRRLALLRPPEPGSAPPGEGVRRAADEDLPLRGPDLAPGRRTADALPQRPPSTQLAFSTIAAAVSALVVAGLPVDRLRTSWLGSMGAAALTAAVATLIQTRGRGQWWRLTGGAGLAFALAVTGVSLPELGLNHSLTNKDRPATFVPPQLTPSTTSTTTTSTTTEPPPGPRISVDPGQDVCPDAVVGGPEATCPVVTIRSTGAAPLRVTSFDIVGAAAGDFRVVRDVTSTSVPGTSVAGGNCLAGPLAFDQVCEVGVSFRPSQAGLRSASLIVHQNLPSPDRGTPVGLVGQGIAGPTTT